MAHPLNVVVLGGGACGMTAAWELAVSGAHVTVIERESRPGGLCGTHERRGFRFDYGGHRFLSQNEELTRRVQMLLGDDFLEVSRDSVVLYRGKKFSYPLRAAEIVRQLPLATNARALADYLQEAARRRLRPALDHSFEDWVVHRFGRTLYGIFFGPYTEKLWGIPPAQISADWASQRISLLDLGDVLLRLLRLRNRGIRTYARRYFYPRRGIGQIFERMADEIRAAGGRLVRGALVTGLETSGLRVRAVHFRRAGDHERVPADVVLSTVPLPVLVRMLDPEPPAAIDGAAARLRFRGVRFLNVLLDRRDVSQHTWMYVAEPRFLFARIQEPRRRSPDNAPPGKTSLMLEIPCDVDGPAWCATDTAIYERCMADLDELGVRGVREATIDYFSTFAREGYPIYHLGYAQDRDHLLEEAARWTNVVTCGRQGAFRYIFMDTAMEMGLDAARDILGGARLSTLRLANFRSERGLIESRAVTA